jgi:hypothetical protein
LVAGGVQGGGEAGPVRVEVRVGLCSAWFYDAFVPVGCLSDAEAVIWILTSKELHWHAPHRRSTPITQPPASRPTPQPLPSDQRRIDLVRYGRTSGQSIRGNPVRDHRDDQPDQLRQQTPAKINKRAASERERTPRTLAPPPRTPLSTSATVRSGSIVISDRNPDREPSSQGNVMVRPPRR